MCATWERLTTWREPSGSKFEFGAHDHIVEGIEILLRAKMFLIILSDVGVCVSGVDDNKFDEELVKLGQDLRNSITSGRELRQKSGGRGWLQLNCAQPRVRFL